MLRANVVLARIDDVEESFERRVLGFGRTNVNSVVVRLDVDRHVATDHESRQGPELALRQPVRAKNDSIVALCRLPRAPTSHVLFVRVRFLTRVGPQCNLRRCIEINVQLRYRGQMRLRSRVRRRGEVWNRSRVQVRSRGRNGSGGQRRSRVQVWRGSRG